MLHSITFRFLEIILLEFLNIDNWTNLFTQSAISGYQKPSISVLNVIALWAHTSPQALQPQHSDLSVILIIIDDKLRRIVDQTPYTPFKLLYRNHSTSLQGYGFSCTSFRRSITSRSSSDNSLSCHVSMIA